MKILQEKIQELFGLALECWDKKLSDKEVSEKLGEAVKSILPCEAEDENASQIRRFLEDELPPFLNALIKTDGTSAQRHRVNNAVAFLYRAIEHLSYLICQGRPWWRD